jgi:hypothetical protein
MVNPTKAQKISIRFKLDEKLDEKLKIEQDNLKFNVEIDRAEKWVSKPHNLEEFYNKFIEPRMCKDHSGYVCNLNVIYYNIDTCKYISIGDPNTTDFTLVVPIETKIVISGLASYLRKDGLYVYENQIFEESSILEVRTNRRRNRRRNNSLCVIC